MKALIQRVSRASVSVAGSTIGKIDAGLLVLLAVEKNDNEAVADSMAGRLCNYRVFADAQQKMNLSVSDVKGGVLLVSQFTLAADTGKGLRPGFSRAAEPALAEALYLRVAGSMRAKGLEVATGKFAADMQVALVNDGPVTFMLEQTAG